MASTTTDLQAAYTLFTEGFVSGQNFDSDYASYSKLHTVTTLKATELLNLENM